MSGVLEEFIKEFPFRNYVFSKGIIYNLDNPEEKQMWKNYCKNKST